MLAALVDPATSHDVNMFYAAPGLAMEMTSASVPDAGSVTACAQGGDCGDGVRVEALSYDAGDLSYEVSSESDVRLILNESYYPGWHVETCSVGGDSCTNLAAGAGPAGSIFIDVPRGSWILNLEYIPPGSQKAWLVFGVSAGCMVDRKSVV